MADDKMEVLTQRSLEELMGAPEVTDRNTTKSLSESYIPAGPRPKVVSEAAAVYRASDQVQFERLANSRPAKSDKRPTVRINPDQDPNNNPDQHYIAVGDIAAAMKERGVTMPDYLKKQLAESKKKV